MAHVTRFNPTTNGDLHLGHVYMMLFNEYEAHSTGGRFLVRFEDNSIDTLGTHSPFVLVLEQMTAYCRRQREAIEWLNIEVDGYERQSEMDLVFKNFVAKHGHYIPAYRFPYGYVYNPALGDYNPEEGEWFPYAPYLTYCRVIYDELDGINLLIRGDDLRSEFSLYQHYRAQLGLPEMKHYYLPRLYGSRGQIVSKFFKAQSVLEYKANGWTPDDIKTGLAVSVLKDPGAGWKLANVKRQPWLVEAFDLPAGVHHHDGANRTYDFVWGD